MKKTDQLQEKSMLADPADIEEDAAASAPRGGEHST